VVAGRSQSWRDAPQLTSCSSVRTWTTTIVVNDTLKAFNDVVDLIVSQGSFRNWSGDIRWVAPNCGVADTVGGAGLGGGRTI